jgi:ABC-type polysaccharide/polyol phosphate transport system ATPase subunit
VSVTTSQLGEDRDRRLGEAPPIITAAQVSKAFRLPHQRYSTLKERVLHPFASSTYDVLQALDDVSFDIKRGEFYGIVGRNGSGQSTLLKCLAGIYGIDRGEMEVAGRLSPFIELGVGFNPDLTARDNVLVNAIMLGLSRREAKRRFDDIIAFAELEDFVDLKLKNYSSGMSIRLGFSVAIQVDAEILLVDEVLAVGDASFQRKCYDEFGRMRDAGKTIVFVTHDMSAIERFCDRAMLLEKGRTLEIGDPDHISARYTEVNFGYLPDADSPLEETRAPECRVRSAWIENEDGERIVSSFQGEVCRACMEVEFHTQIDYPVFTVTFRNDVRHVIFVATSAPHGPPGAFGAGDRAVVRLTFVNWLAPSRYALTPAVTTWDPDYRVVDQREDLASLIVEAPRRTGGATDLPTELEITRL